MSSNEITQNGFNIVFLLELLKNLTVISYKNGSTVKRQVTMIIYALMLHTSQAFMLKLLAK